MAARSGNEFDAEPGIEEPNDGENRQYERVAREDTHNARDAVSFFPQVPPEIDPALSRTIENEIIPRLLMAHRTGRAKRSGPTPEVVAVQAEVEQLVSIAVNDAIPASRTFVDALHARGLSIESIIANLLPAAARHVGLMWEADACTFVDVTFALSRFQLLLRHYARSLETDLPKSGEGRRVLLSSMPGEQHTFGLGVVEEFFRRAAWDVVPQTPSVAKELFGYVSGEWFDVVGLSASTDGAVSKMTRLIEEIRNRSLNKSVRIIVGGAAVLRMPDFAATVGADVFARDPREGINQMEWMMQSLQRPC